MQTDITAAGTPRLVVDTCVERLGSVDILINSAGVGPDRGCPRLRPIAVGRDGRRQPHGRLRDELRGRAADGAAAERQDHQHLLGLLVPRRSAVSRPTRPRSTASLASPRPTATSSAEHNIQVNGIAPGYYATAITAATRSDPETNKRVLDHIPAGRWGDPFDLMGAVVFLASRASDYVNGHILAVDGGYLVR